MKTPNQLLSSSPLLHRFLVNKNLNQRTSMFTYQNSLALGSVLLAQTALGYPQGAVLNPTLITRDNEFIFSAIGDSWGVRKLTQSLHIH